jgi:uncharacterized protein
MDVTPLIPRGRQVLTGYGGGGFKINNEFTAGSLILLPERWLPWEVAQPFAAESLRLVLPLLADIDILLAGTGRDMLFAPDALRAEFRAHGVALEVMSTGAACRTYNVLLSEERRVGAALIAL